MKLKIMLFAQLRELFESPVIELDFDSTTTGTEILNRLETLQPEISPLKKYLKISVNSEYIPLDQKIESGGEIAVFPPVSGG